MQIIEILALCTLAPAVCVLTTITYCRVKIYMAQAQPEEK